VRVTSFNVKNYKCHKDTSIDLSNFHVLIGKNNSGKTSIIECFKLLKDYFEKNRQEL